jgi:transposase
MANKKATKPLSRTQRVRILTKEGRSVQEIAATVGVTTQFVYNVQWHERKKAKAAEAAAASPRISTVTGKPVRPYKKRKAKKSLAERGAELRQWAAERTELPPVPAEPQVKYIEIEVPQPHYSLTWGQRFKALFTGRV